MPPTISSNGCDHSDAERPSIPSVNFWFHVCHFTDPFAAAVSIVVRVGIELNERPKLQSELADILPCEMVVAGNPHRAKLAVLPACKPHCANAATQMSLLRLKNRYVMPQLLQFIRGAQPRPCPAPTMITLSGVRRAGKSVRLTENAGQSAGGKMAEKVAAGWQYRLVFAGGDRSS